jgi:hypothetical protein
MGNTREAEKEKRQCFWGSDIEESDTARKRCRRISGRDGKKSSLSPVVTAV